MDTMNPLRNTGRTYRALKRAIESLDQCPDCIYLVLNHDAVEDLDPMVREIAGDLGKHIPLIGKDDSFSYGFYDPPHSMLQLSAADVNVCLGKRAHFVIDHAVGENIPVDEYQKILEAISCCDPLGVDTGDNHEGSCPEHVVPQ